MTAPTANAVAPLVARIDELLPQTQCGKCGFGGCLPYAVALAADDAALNRCPPGGAATIDALAALLCRPPLPLDPACGVAGPPEVAFIDEAFCIGCTRCLPPCPVDAIAGANKHLHTVIAAECTGCGLCLPLCPTDCITLVPASGPRPTPAASRARYAARNARQARLEAEREAALAARAAAFGPGDEQEPR